MGVAIYMYFWIKSGTPCLVMKYLHVPCPVCGMTRAWKAALQLDFETAFAMHPMFWAIPILVLYVLYDMEPFKNKYLNRTVLLVILIGIMLNYISVLLTFFGIV